MPFKCGTRNPQAAYGLMETRTHNCGRGIYRNASMNPGMIYTKTGKGRAEVAGRGQSLNPVQRRLLIVIDGKKTVNDLEAFVRIDELDAALDFLQREDLIESTDHIESMPMPVAPGFVSAHAAQAPRAATSPSEFKQVRQETSRFVLDHLGAAGEPICSAIERCESPAELRQLLRGVEIFIGQRLSPESTQQFVRHFGALLL